MAQLSPRLEAWRRTAAATEKRTVIVRVRSATDAAMATGEIEAAGARVESAGAGAITVVADPAGLEAVAALPFVLAVEEPRMMQLKVPKP
jgi:hypothetical protein